MPDCVVTQTLPCGVPAETKTKTLPVDRDVLRSPPLDGRAPVSDSASEIPSAFARKATASPLNVVVACAKLAIGLRAKIAVRQMAIVEFFFVFICTSPLLQFEFQGRLARRHRERPSVGQMTVNT